MPRKTSKEVLTEEPIVVEETNTPLEPVAAHVRANRLNIRKAPSTTAEIVRVANIGEAFDIVSTDPIDGFYKLTDGTYAMAEFVVID